MNYKKVSDLWLREEIKKFKSEANMLHRLIVGDFIVSEKEWDAMKMLQAYNEKIADMKNELVRRHFDF